MYAISRFFLICTVVALAYCLVLLTMLAPGLIVIVVVAIVAVVKRRRGPLTACGSARFATREELRQANMLDSPDGLNVGDLVDADEKNPIKALKALFDFKLTHEQACCEFLGFYTGRRLS